MKRILFFTKNQLNQPEFKICYAVLILISLGGMIMGYADSYQSDWAFIRSAADNFLLASTVSRVLASLFALTFPLLAAALCSGYRRGNALFSMLRMDKRQYIYGNAFVAVGVTVIGFMAVLTLNQLLCFVAFPRLGADNIWGMEPFMLCTSFLPELLFDVWTVQNPYVYNMLYILIISILAGGISLLAYGMGCVKRLRNLKPVQLSVLVFVIFILLMIAGSFLDIGTINFLSYVNMSQRASVREYVVFTGCIYAAGGTLTVRGEKTYEYI